MPLRISTGEVCTFANTWNCVVHGLCGDINGPVHYALCPISGSIRRETERELRREAYTLAALPTLRSKMTWER